MIPSKITDGTNNLSISPRGRVMVEPPDSDFTVRTNNGEVEGYDNFFLIAYAPNVTTSFTDIWGAGTTMTLPTAAESYELVCANANDTAAGTGARAVTISTLNESGLVRTQTVATNGGIVQLSGLHMFPRSMVVSSCGSSTTNVGDITLRVSGAGATRDYIIAGNSSALSGHYRVPANKTFHIIGLDYHTGGATKKMTLRSEVMFPGTNTWVTTSVLPIVEQSFTVNFRVSAPFPAGTIIRYRAKVSNGGGSGDDVASILSGYEVDI